jgi:hypothetical protein
LTLLLLPKLDDETDNIFGYMKRRCWEESSVLSPTCSPTGDTLVTPWHPFFSNDYLLGTQGKLSSLSWDNGNSPRTMPKCSNSCTFHQKQLW